MNLDIIKEKISSSIGKNVKITVYGLRNKINFYEGTIYKTYPNIFVIKYEEENRNVTYSYTDILTRTVEVDVFDGNGYSPLLPPVTETKKQRNLA